MRITNVYKALKACGRTNSSTEKVALLKEAETKASECRLLRYTLEQACSPYITFGVKKYTFGEPTGDIERDTEEHIMHMWEVIKLIVHHLAIRSLTGNKALEAITKASHELTTEYQYILGCILDKDLKCGINVKTVNKVFPELIPEFSCQLASKNTGDIKFPCLAEIKYNGRRNVAIVDVDSVTHFSRNGKEQPNFSCFDEELIAIAGGVPLVFDGEVHGVGEDNTKAYKAVQEQARRKKNVDTTNLRFTMWDILLRGEWKKQICTKKQHERSENLKFHLYTYWEDSDKDEPTVLLSKAKVINSQEELDKYYAKVLKQGHEGLIIKSMDGLYEYKRSKNWIKMKANATEDLKIVDVVERIEKKKKTGILGAVVVKRGKVKVHCPTGKGIGREKATKLWKKRKKLIGRIAEVSFQNITDAGSLFLPKFLRVRSDKNKADK